MGTQVPVISTLKFIAPHQRVLILLLITTQHWVIEVHCCSPPPPPHHHHHDGQYYLLNYYSKLLHDPCFFLLLNFLKRLFLKKTLHAKNARGLSLVCRKKWIR
jgi:hypothetical protein